MTYRERREAKADRLREWSQNRVTKAEAVFKADEPFTHDHAFNTQPGHIPGRARIIAREHRAFESLDKAQDMTRRAGGIESQLDHAIYDDDPDAIERLEERIAKHEAKASLYTAVNKAWRKGGAEAIRAEFGDRIAEVAANTMSLCRWLRAPLDTTNLRARIRTDKARIEQLRNALTTIGAVPPRLPSR